MQVSRPADAAGATLIRTANGMAVAALLTAAPVLAQAADIDATPIAGDAAALAKELSNPVAALISVPFQFNFDGDIGPEVGGSRDGERVTLNVQPVIPIRLNDNWNLISRTIVPVVWQHNVYPGAGNQFGLGDTVQSAFFSPAKPGSFIWGLGPVVLAPTGTDDLLSGKKWGGGPTGVVLKQMGPWTVGGLANHIWSFAGSDKRGDISATYVNPFVSYATKTAFTVSVSADATYDWKIEKLTMPVNFTVSQITRIGGQLVSVGGGFRYYAVTTDNSPHGLAARFVMTMLFPKKK